MNLQKILHAINEIEICLFNQRQSQLYEDQFNWLWGELDWREELHDLLKERNGISA